MKTSKKIIIPFFSTIVGLSLAAGVGGALAWYQYNSQTSASFIGTSVAKTGTLQLGYMVDDDGDSATPAVLKWGTDFYRDGDDLVPVTFGALDETDKSLGAKAYAYPTPEAGYQAGYAGWEEAEEGKHYAQFDLYFRALQTDKNAAGDETNGIKPGYKLVERDVFLSDYVFECADNTKVADEALRVHLDVEDGTNRLISKTAHAAAAPLNLYGPLDLDGNGEDDVYTKSLFHDIPTGKQAGDTIEYGVKDDTQVTEAISGLKQERDATTGKMPASTDTNYSKRILRTSTTKNIKVTVTIWLEGWEALKVAADESKDTIWNAKYSAETDVKVGLQFDTGIFRDADLAQ